MGDLHISPNSHIIRNPHDKPSTDPRREFLMIWGICANSHDVIETSPNRVDIRLCQLGIHVWSKVEMAMRI